MKKRELLKAIYEAIRWDRLYEILPAISREQVDELFQELSESLAEEPETPEELAAKIAGAEAVLHCDGASRGNPGPAGIGMVLRAPKGEQVLAWGASIGRATNNVAEYHALIAGLVKAVELEVKRIRILTDSELLARQIEGIYKVRKAHLRPLHAEAMELLGRFDKWQVRHVPREANQQADKLAARYARQGRRRSRKAERP